MTINNSIKELIFKKISSNYPKKNINEKTYFKKICSLINLEKRFIAHMFPEEVKNIKRYERILNRLNP